MPIDLKSGVLELEIDGITHVTKGRLFTTFHEQVLGIKCHEAAGNDYIMSKFSAPQGPLENRKITPRQLIMQEFHLYSGQLSHQDSLFRHLFDSLVHFKSS